MSPRPRCTNLNKSVRKQVGAMEYAHQVPINGLGGIPEGG
jgi:hypothetical protein